VYYYEDTDMQTLWNKLYYNLYNSLKFESGRHVHASIRTSKELGSRKLLTAAGEQNYAIFDLGRIDQNTTFAYKASLEK